MSIKSDKSAFLSNLGVSVFLFESMLLIEIRIVKHHVAFPYIKQVFREKPLTTCSGLFARSIALGLVYIDNRQINISIL
jgi:hypothetical protein